MKHFGLTEWTDFVRELVDPSRRTLMKRHLSSGCRSCGEAVELFERLLPVCRREADYEAPAFAVRRAKAIYALQQPEKVHILPRILARLVFDSFREPQPAGVRSLQRLSRQALYEAGDFCVDLRLESEAEGGRVSLVGQIASRKDPDRRMASVPVLLLAGKRVAGRAVSNQFGEFHITYRPSTRLRLYVPVRGEKSIEVSLGRMEGKQPARTGTAARRQRVSRSRRLKRS